MKYFFFFLLLVPTPDCFAQQQPLSKWTVEITFNRQISTNLNITDKGQCDTKKKEGHDVVRIDANFKSDLLLGEDFTNSVQLMSDQESSILSKEHPLQGNGSFSNSGAEHDINTCDCNNSCGDCKTTYDFVKTYGGNGYLDISKVGFSFDYDLITKHGTLHLKVGYIKDGTLTTTAKDCHDTKTTDMSQAYKVGLDIFDLSFGTIQVQNFDPYKEAGFDAATVAMMHQAQDATGNGGIATINENRDGFEVSYSYSNTITRPVKSSITGEERDASGTDQTTITTTIHAFFKHKINRPQMEITISGYNNWLPEAGKDNNTEGNGLTVNAMLKNEDEKSKIVITAKKIEFELLNTSKEPGLCMNKPNKDPSHDFDLKFSSGNPGTVSANQQRVTIEKKDMTETAVRINSYDWGGYATLHAKATLSDGKVVDGYIKVDGNQITNILIPYRKDESSQVAEYWKEQNKATDLADDDDDEKGEDGVGDHHGDGFTLYEEYRGFIENEKHIRTDPLKKDAMICNRIEENRERSENGIALYQGVTHFIVHKDFKAEEFGRHLDAAEDPGAATQYDVEQFLYDKVLNCNFTKKTHEVDQHGILMLPSPLKLGAAFAVPNSKAAKSISTPKNYTFLVIPADFKTNDSGYAITHGDIVNGETVKYDQTGHAKIITDFYASRVAHEMLHCTNVAHHGEGDYWYGQYLALDKTGITFQELTMDGHGVDKNNDDIADSKKVRLIGTDGKEIFANDPRWDAGGAWVSGIKISFVGVQGGQHSGNDDCIMRYDVSLVYEKGNTHYAIVNPDSFTDHDIGNMFNQLTGITLCSSPAGTGINKAPNGRFGDASKGNCKHQVCINDKYH